MIGGLIGVTVANRYSREIKDKNGKTVGRVSTSRSTANKKPSKRINYNMRQISARILKCKTSGSARMALTGARAKVAQLKRQMYDYGVDRYDLEHAIIHATKIMRVAKKSSSTFRKRRRQKQADRARANRRKWKKSSRRSFWRIQRRREPRTAWAQRRAKRRFCAICSGK